MNDKFYVSYTLYTNVYSVSILSQRSITDTKMLCMVKTAPLKLKLQTNSEPSIGGFTG